MSNSTLKPMSQMFSSALQKRMMTREREARKELSTLIKNASAQITETEYMIADALDAETINFTLIVSQMTNIDSIKSRLEKLNVIQRQLFPDCETVSE